MIAAISVSGVMSVVLLVVWAGVLVWAIADFIRLLLRNKHE